jgi:hypothetical protein
LVNPARDLGPQHIHGIQSRDVLPAPFFADIAGDLAIGLAGWRRPRSSSGSLSGKAIKARQYGIAIVTPEAFGRLVAEMAAPAAVRA